MKWLTMCVCGVMCLGAMACSKQKVESEEVNEVSTTPPPREEVAEEKSSDLIVLGPFKIYDATNPSQAIEMNDQGAILMAGTEIAVVHTDGRVMRGEALLATLNEDGSIVSADGQMFPMMLGADGVASAPGAPERVYFGDDGSLVGQNENAPVMASEGCSGDVARTCMLVLLVSSMPMPPQTSEP